MSETTTDMAALVERGRAKLTARAEAYSKVEGQPYPKVGEFTKDWMRALHSRDVFENWLSVNGPALLDAVQSAQQRAEAAEREASRAYDEGAETAIAISNRIVRESGLERIAMQQDRDTARAENAALREALAWYADPEQYRVLIKPNYALVNNDGGIRARAALAETKGETK